MAAAKQEEQSAEKADAADAVDEAITTEMEGELKTQHELQAQVDALGAQVATLMKQNASGTQPMSGKTVERMAPSVPTLVPTLPR